MLMLLQFSPSLIVYEAEQVGVAEATLEVVLTVPEAVYADGEVNE